MNGFVGKAVWQCPRCHVIREFPVWAVMTASPGPSMCPCYSLAPAQGCVELRSIMIMEPLNDLARGFDRSLQEQRNRWAVERAEILASRQRAQDYLDSWG